VYREPFGLRFMLLAQVCEADISFYYYIVLRMNIGMKLIQNLDGILS